MRSLIFTVILTFAAMGTYQEGEDGPPNHGPDAVCTQWCTPDGERHEAPDGMPVVKCAGAGGDSCAKMGSACGGEHRDGCTEWCRVQCCSCCSI